MIRKQDIPFIDAIKSIQGTGITSNQIDMVAAKTSSENSESAPMTGNQVVTMMLFHEIIVIDSHLGQPRHGDVINGGRIHNIKVLV